MLTSFAGLLAALVAPVQPMPLALKATIAERDKALFKIVFEECNPAKLRSMVTDDFEMYHDQDGVVATSADQFVADYAKQCAAKSVWHSRREIATASVTYNAVPGFGAIQDGDHVFYEWRSGGKQRLAGRAHFTHLWKQSPDGWRLARVFSFRHQAVK